MTDTTDRAAFFTKEYKYVRCIKFIKGMRSELCCMCTRSTYDVPGPVFFFIPIVHTTRSRYICSECAFLVHNFFEEHHIKELSQHEQYKLAKQTGTT